MTCTSRCSASRTRWRRFPRARRATRRWTTCIAASPTIATGTGCSAASTSPTCVPRPSPTSSPPRTPPIERSASPRAPSFVTSHWTGATRSASRTTARRYRIVRLDPDRAVMARDGAATMDGHRYPLSAEIEVLVGGGRMDPSLSVTATIRNTGDRALEARVGIEWALTMLGGGGNPEAWWEIEGERSGHDSTGAATGVARIGQGNSWLGLTVETAVSPPADAWHAPIETVSNSEAGFERVYQGGALLLSWPVSIPPGGSWSASVEHRATVDVDRAVAEAGQLLENLA